MVFKEYIALQIFHSNVKFYLQSSNLALIKSVRKLLIGFLQIKIKFKKYYIKLLYLMVCLNI